MELSVVMPCLNEAETIAACIKKAKKSFEKNGIDGEVVVADNGSTDGSREIARSCNARVVDIKRKGYGSALNGGIEAAHGKFIIIGDADDSYDFSNLTPFIEELRKGCDLVMGNRFQGGIEPGAMPWKHKYIGNPVLTGIGKMFFKCPSSDFHCGLRGFSKDAYNRLGMVTTGMEFASEMIIKATLSGMKITEVPTRLFKDGRSRPPHLRSWQDGWRHLRFMLLYSPKWLFYYPGLILIFTGMITFAFLLTGDVSVGNITFGVHSMLFSAIAVILGYQSVLFSLFACNFAKNNGLLIGDNFKCSKKQKQKKFSLEKNVAYGLALFISGCILAFLAVAVWGRGGFAKFDPRFGLKFVIPSTALMVLGVQSLMASFFLGILNLQRR